MADTEPKGFFLLQKFMINIFFFSGYAFAFAMIAWNNEQRNKKYSRFYWSLFGFFIFGFIESLIQFIYGV